MNTNNHLPKKLKYLIIIINYSEHQPFRELQKEENVGININSNWLMNVHINRERIQGKFQEDDKIIKCLNHPT